MRKFFKNTLRRVAYIFGAVSLFFGLLPLVHRVFNLGAALMIGFGALTTLTTALWDRFNGWGHISRRLRLVSDHRTGEAPYWWRILRGVIVLGLIVCVIIGTASSIMMLVAANRQPLQGATVVVLGCRVEGDKPSLMMQRRLDVALHYLQNSPESKVVCSGGKGPQNTYSEAKVMSMYLEQNGISAERIFLEEQSTSTEENIGFSKRIIEEKGLPYTVALATDTFHQFRAQYYAKESGLESAALPSKTPWGIVSAYWVREWFAMVKAWAFGQRF